MLFICSALAAGPLILPGAEPVEAGEVRMYVSGQYVTAAGSWRSDALWGIVGARWSPSSRWQVRGALPVAVSGEDPTPRLVAPSAAVRYIAWSGPPADIAGWAGIAFFPEETFGEETWSFGGAVGLAVRAGGEHVYVDASTPLVATWAGDVRVTPLLLSEAGLNLTVQGHTVRLGMASAMPGLSYSWEGEHWSFDVAAHTMVLATYARARMGVRF
jgi:hypothetical protein